MSEMNHATKSKVDTTSDYSIDSYIMQVERKINPYKLQHSTMHIGTMKLIRENELKMSINLWNKALMTTITLIKQRPSGHILAFQLPVWGSIAYMSFEMKTTYSQFHKPCILCLEQK